LKQDTGSPPFVVEEDFNIGSDPVAVKAGMGAARRNTGLFAML
jgi:hypothetical protein